MIEFDELIDIVPDPAVRRMENVGTIAMDMDAVLLFTIDIAADMVPSFQDQALLARQVPTNGRRRTAARTDSRGGRPACGFPDRRAVSAAD